MPEFEALGKQVREPRRNLETFARPAGVTRVAMESDEFTSLCPVTGQPDWEHRDHRVCSPRPVYREQEPQAVPVEFPGGGDLLRGPCRPDC